MITIPDAAIEAASEAFYSQGVAEWKALVTCDPSLAKTYRQWMRAALKAAMPEIRAQWAQEIRALSVGSFDNPEDCCEHNPDECGRCWGREHAARHLEGGES